MRLIEHLLWLAGRWEAVTGRKRSRLASLMVNDGKLFIRIADDRPISIPVFEKCVAFLGTRSNWPDDRLPDDVAARIAALSIEHTPNVESEPLDRAREAA
jgi:hypothetical protein